jgi:hypothetical protein
MMLGYPICFIEFTTEYKRLGSIVHPSLTSDADVDERNRTVKTGKFCVFFSLSLFVSLAHRNFRVNFFTFEGTLPYRSSTPLYKVAVFEW